MIGLDVCKQYDGLQQDRNNTQLRNLLASEAVNGDIAINPAQTSWCAAWMNFCERSIGNPGTGSLAALSFKTYGQSVDPDNAQPGDILVFVFPFDSPGHGHVTYFLSWDDDANTVNCLGGNQNHMIKESAYVQDYIVAIRRF